MTQLLISIKNLQEAEMVLATDVDIIDLKDPLIGALGALDLALTKKIVHLVNGVKLVSATVGEHHHNVDALILAMQTYADAGVDMIKIPVSDLLQAVDFYQKITEFIQSGVKVVAVFFADEAMNLTLLPRLKNAGFYGAMLDTSNKQQNLLQVQHQQFLSLFTQQCHQLQLSSGLAGSLQPQHVELLHNLNATYIGFRGGVCVNAQRKSVLCANKLNQVLHVLRKGNKTHTKAQSILGLALHS